MASWNSLLGQHGYVILIATVFLESIGLPRIRGSRRLDPNALHQCEVTMPGVGAVYVYCTCVRQATSTRVARELQKMYPGKGSSVTVIRGGLRAWRKAGLPIEPVPRAEMAALPIFGK
jgi:rhodanese-related sulfurtransferase